MGQGESTETTTTQTLNNEELAEITSEDDIKKYYNTKFPIIISKQIFNMKNELIKMRRYFHKNAELSFNEKNTSLIIIEYLKKLNIEIINNKYNNIKTGVIGLLNGNNNGPCIMLRADMDALPINEKLNKYNKEFISQNKGVMHACGHDAHMTILLGAATALSKLRHLLHGSVKFCFQPGEEGYAGGKLMINSGILQNPTVNQVYGLHVWSYDKFGTVRVINGPLMAGALNFKIKILGKGGHAALPHKSNDVIIAASYLIQQINTIISRNINPLENAVITIGYINSGYQANIISDIANIGGTIRWFKDNIKNIILQRMRDIFIGIEKSFKVKIEFQLVKMGDTVDHYPPTINSDKKCVNIVKKCIKEVLPKIDFENNENNYNINKPTMGAEDFSFYLQEKPGCFFFLGCGVDEYINDDNNDNNKDNDKNRKIFAHHKPDFIVDERCLTIGAQIMTSIVLENLLPNDMWDNDTNK